MATGSVIFGRKKVLANYDAANTYSKNTVGIHLVDACSGITLRHLLKILHIPYFSPYKKHSFLKKKGPQKV